MNIKSFLLAAVLVCWASITEAQQWQRVVTPSRYGYSYRYIPPVPAYYGYRPYQNHPPAYRVYVNPWGQVFYTYK